MSAINPSIVGKAIELRPLLAFKPNSVLEAEDKAKAQAAQRKPEVSNLAGWLKAKWDDAKRAKIPHETKMLQDLRQRDGQYDPEDLALIRKSHQPEIYMMLTATVCRAGEAWIKDVLLKSDTPPYGIEPTPIPELDPDIQGEIDAKIEQAKQQALMQAYSAYGYVGPEFVSELEAQAAEISEELANQRLKAIQDDAKEKARKMEDKIEDQLREGGFYDALADCINDFATFPSAILKGPVVRRRRSLAWVAENNGYVAKSEDVFRTEYQRVSPFDIYPLSSTSDIQKGGFFERQKLSVDELSAMIGTPGYNEASIRAVIDEYGRSGYREVNAVDSARSIAEGRTTEFLTSPDTIDALEWWGKVPGNLLLDFGMTPKDIPDRSASYEVNCLLIGNYVCSAVINPNPMGRRPYGKASYEEVPGQFWGKAPPRLMRDCQKMCNAAARALAANMAIASGPQVAINAIERIPVGENIEEQYPWKIWQFTADQTGRADNPIQFFQPSLIAEPLLEIYDRFSRTAHEHSGIVASSYGSDQSAGAGKTASGQAMLQSNASKVLAAAIGHIDEGIIRQCVESQFFHNMLFDDDENIKGDLRIVAKGSSQLLVREQAQIRRNEFLASTNNPVDLQIMGMEGRATVLREVAKTLQMEKEVVPSEQEMQAQQIQAQQAAMMPAPQELDPSGMALAGGVEARTV